MIDILKIIPPTDKDQRVSYVRRMIWKRPSYLAKRAEIAPRMVAAAHTPEANAKRNKTMRATMGTDEFKKKRSGDIKRTWARHREHLLEVHRKAQEKRTAGIRRHYAARRARKESQ